MNKETLPPGGLQKFGFDTEFFEVAGGNEHSVPRVIAGAKQQETQRQQAYQDGYTAGLQAGQEQAQADLALLQQHMQQTLHALQQGLNDREEQLQAQLLGLLNVTLQQILGHAAQHYGALLLEHHLRTLLPLVKTDEALTLYIHPSARGYHEKLGLSQASVLGLTMRIVVDGKMGPVDAVVEWQNGGVENRLAQHIQALHTLLLGAGAAALEVPVTIPTFEPHRASAEPFVPQAVQPAGASQVATDPLDAMTEANKARAAALLGDDELLDALK
jgi:flagellar biosynthesis/type III secretory pathway protein FliH